MEKLKQRATISAPSMYRLSRAKPVIKATRKIARLQSSMALRLCETGPGESVILTHSAPSDKVSPWAKCPNCESNSDGSNTPSVMRNPSEKYWLNKKY